MIEQSGISLVASWIAMDAAMLIEKPFSTSSHNIYNADWEHFLGILEGRTNTP